MLPLRHRAHELGLLTFLVSSPNPQDAGKPILCFPHSFEARFAFHLLLLQCLKRAFFPLEVHEQSIAQSHVFSGLAEKSKL